jgi:hypothetical protein
VDLMSAPMVTIQLPDDGDVAGKGWSPASAPETVTHTNKLASEQSKYRTAPSPAPNARFR